MNAEHSETSPPSETPPPAGSGSVADELRAAVLAVQRGERSADSFFPRAEPAPAAQGRAAGRAGSVPRPGAGAAGGTPPSAASVEGVAKLLAEGAAPESLAVRAAAVLGESAERELRADPWLLLAVPGVPVEQADDFARALLGADCSPADERRTRALTAWLLDRAALAGHTAVTADEVTRGLAGQAVPDPDEAMRDAVEAGAVLAFHDPDPDLDLAAEPAADAGPDAPEAEPRQTLLGLDRYALAEESLADGLVRLLATFGSAPEAEAAADEAADGDTGGDTGADTMRSRWAAAADAAPSPSAAALIRAVAGSGLVAHTGGEAARAEPAALIAAARSLGLRACAAAHTADGRRRLAASLPAEAADAAVTVDGLIAGREGPDRDPDGLLPLDLLAVLDAPQLGAEAAAFLVEALPDGARLVLSGDPGLLGAAAPGQVLVDVLAAGVCPHVTSRETTPGPVGRLVAGIADGALPQVEAPDREVVIVPVRDAGEAVHRTVQLVADSIPRAFDQPADTIQVITTGHGGAAGTRALNAALKERLHPGPGRFGGFDPGDRVVYSPAPGHVRPATVASADAEGLWLTDEQGRFAVPRERVTETVRHGWAITAHQAAGSRWPAAVVVLPGDATAALDRSWVYTAFGRGERHLSVVQGVGGALPRAVAGPGAAGRTTRLRALLRAQGTAD
ncbi:helix-hairpin-helix domain-containing protein [Streptomyces sp. B6B3]|uniref:helix-hairpin-helix domain-containing protein n=1 Tax=Streptomyces sp. B6B3 TaxID=3153570 RepID=UPI00325E5D41